MLVPAKVASAETAGTTVKEPQQQAAASAPAVTPSLPPAPTQGWTAKAIVLNESAKAQDEAAPAATLPEIAPSVVPAKVPLRTEGDGDAAPTPIPQPEVIAVERSETATFAVPPPSPVPVIAVAPSTPVTPSPEALMPVPRNTSEVAQQRVEPVVPERAVDAAKLDLPEREVLRLRLTEQLEAARVEAARLEAERLKAERQEATRLAAAQVEAQHQAAARIEAARLEAARVEAQRQEAARLAGAQLEVQRQEVARQGAARVEAARQDAARLEAERAAAARQGAAAQEAARVLAEKEEDAKRAARREAMGRTLNEEAAKRATAETAARSPSTLPYSYSTARRARLWGRSDPNVELVQYAESWARKIQFDTPTTSVREVATRPHTNPVVSVAIRSDGSVESVTFVLSSGVAEVDEAIRRIVNSHVPYRAFPPGLARDYDVIEVRRTWHFDTAIRLY